MKLKLVTILTSFFMYLQNIYAITEQELKINKIYVQNSPSVVQISTYIELDTVFRDFFEDTSRAIGSGSGFVWDKEGYIVTNYHVIKDANKFLISFKNDTKFYEAMIWGKVPSKDLAVLKLIKKPDILRPISVGTSKDLIVGQHTYAIGNPFGEDHTLTSGIISALDRQKEGIGNVKIQGMIQTDAAINQGNSGGPLLDSDGNLIGINTQIISPSGGSIGLGFAIPVDIIKKFVPQIIRYREIIRADLGIRPISLNVKEMIGLEKGYPIPYVIRNGPADKAGIQGMQQSRYYRLILGDILLNIDGKEINSYDDYFNLMDRYRHGQTVKVRIKRKNKEYELQVTLGAARE